jgi:gluconate 2-dehydrogenase gamma chain
MRTSKVESAKVVAGGEGATVAQPAHSGSLELSRRRFMAVAAGGVAAGWFGFEQRDLLAAGAHAARATSAQAFEVLSAVDGADLEAAAAQIIPTDATPGAREARVIHFIDRSLASFAKAQRPAFAKAAAELRERAKRVDANAKSFAALTPARQIAVLTAMEHDKSESFRAIREATIAGMLSNPEYGGNVGKSGWHWIGFNDQFSWSAPFGWYDRNV